MNSLIYKLKSKLFRQTKYPEIEKVGGLANAINFEFEKLNSALKVAVDEHYDEIPVTYAKVEKGNKFSQIYIATEEKLYLPDFWLDGVCLAHGSIASLSDLAQAVHYWLTQKVTTQELSERFNFVQPNGKAEAFDKNKEVEYTWMSLVSEDDSLGLKEFIDLASTDELLNKLFPYTSLSTLCFSKCTGFPFDTTDLPNVTPIEYMHFSLPNITSDYAKLRQVAYVPNGKLYVVRLKLVAAKL
ncbi:MAG: DUF6193 family natural product biosynthesis protein [Chitinophagaceae bacterium]